VSDPRKIVIVDMDGTLADVSHRLHFLNGPKKNWKQFFAGMDDDPPSTVVVDWVRNLSPDYEVVIVTGRPDKYHTNTESWLRKHGIEFSRIIMRRSGDHRPDYVVKKELLDEVGRERVAFVIDDRPSVCDMWRALGLRVYQVAIGAEY
jgi:FMN phosphatase YigB (HAD superfamily)